MGTRKLGNDFMVLFGINSKLDFAVLQIGSGCSNSG